MTKPCFWAGFARTQYPSNDDQPDSHLWEEEVVELFITPSELNRYYEFQWNPLATPFDAIVKNELDPQGKSKNYHFDATFTATNLTAAVVVNGSIGDSSDRDEGWQVEVMIPFSVFGPVPPQPKDVWRGIFSASGGTNRYHFSVGHRPGFTSPTVSGN